MWHVGEQIATQLQEQSEKGRPCVSNYLWWLHFILNLDFRVFILLFKMAYGWIESAVQVDGLNVVLQFLNNTPEKEVVRNDFEEKESPETDQQLHCWIIIIPRKKRRGNHEEGLFLQQNHSSNHVFLKYSLQHWTCWKNFWQKSKILLGAWMLMKVWRKEYNYSVLMFCRNGN